MEEIIYLLVVDIPENILSVDKLEVLVDDENLIIFKIYPLIKSDK